MTAIIEHTHAAHPTTALLDAVQQIRKARHFQGCRCFMYRKDGAAYCSEQEAWWNHCISRLLDNYLALPRWSKAEVDAIKQRAREQHAAIQDHIE